MQLLKENCSMKTKTLKNYGNKKFFYRLFMRKYPCGGAMFALAWMICLKSIFPLVPWGVGQICRQFSAGAGIDVALTIIVLCILFLIYAYMLLVFAQNLYTISRNQLKKSRIWKIPALIGAWSFPLSGVMVAAVAIKKRLCLVLAAAVLSIIFYISAFRVGIDKVNSWWCINIQSFLLLIAIAAVGKQEKRKWVFIYPVVIFFLVVSNMYFLELVYKAKVFANKFEISSVAVCGLEPTIEGWKKRNQYGFPVNKEPLKSFSKFKAAIRSERYPTAQESEKYLAELRKKHPDFFASWEKLRRVKPQRISYRWETPSSMILPELQAFRAYGEILFLEMRAAPQNKKRIMRCNNDFLLLREWCFNNETLIGKLVAVAIESMRLHALAYPMAKGAFSKQEMLDLIGTAPDWNRQFSMSIASECALDEEVVAILAGTQFEPGFTKLYGRKMAAYWKICQKNMPLSWRVNLLRDHNFALEYYLQVHSLLHRSDLSGIEKRKAAEIDVKDLISEHFFVSGTVLGAISRMFSRADQIKDIRRMAVAAAEVRYCCKRPLSLDAVKQKNLSFHNKQPYVLEWQNEGFRIYFLKDDGKKPGKDDKIHSYTVCFK